MNSIRGSEWNRWDLHLHTASSYDYKYKAKDADDLRWIPFKAEDTIAVARLKSKDSENQLAMEKILMEIIEGIQE